MTAAHSSDLASGEVLAVILKLSEFVRTHDRTVLSDARKGIGSIATYQSQAVGEALWDIAIKLQREILPTGEGE